MCWESVKNNEKETLEQLTRKKKASTILYSHREIKNKIKLLRNLSTGIHFRRADWSQRKLSEWHSEVSRQI